MFYKQLSQSCLRLLDEGVDQLDLSIGIVSHIYNGYYTIIAINSEVGDFVKDATFPLEKTYCREVFESGKTKAIAEIDGVPGLRLHPLYLELPLEAYLGAPIRHHGEVWGTVNFSASKVHKPFTRQDKALVEGYARTIAGWLNEMDSAPSNASR